MAHYTNCPRCSAKYDVTTCLDGTTFVCDECGYEVTVTYEVENKIPGGLTVKTKILGDGTKWLECPKCQKSTEITKISAGNRFRCQRCNLLLQVPIDRKPEKRKTRAIRAEDILTCPSCKTKYDISGYSPGNRFRCRSCSLTLTVPAPTDWTGTGEWEIDVEKGVIQCNGCSMSFPMAEYMHGGTFQCRNCQKSFTPSVDLAQIARDREPESDGEGNRASGGGEGWDHSPDTGMATCRSCGYSYDVSGMKSGADFVCPRCDVVFKMPATVQEDGMRERVVCQSCNEAYDVSGYLRGTMFTCQNCDAVILVGKETVRETLATLADSEEAGGQGPDKAACVAATPVAAVESEPPTPEGEPIAEVAPPAPPEEPATLDDTAMSVAHAASAEPSGTLGDESIFEKKEAKETVSSDSEEEGKVLLVCNECDQSYLVPRSKDNLKRKCKLCGGLLAEKGAAPSEATSAEEVTEEHFERIAAVVEEVEEIEVSPAPEKPAPPVEEKPRIRKKKKVADDGKTKKGKAGKTKKKLVKKKKGKADKTKKKGKK